MFEQMELLNLVNGSMEMIRLKCFVNGKISVKVYRMRPSGPESSLWCPGHGTYRTILIHFSAKNIIELNSKGSNLVVDDPNFNNDPIQLMSGRAIHQLFNKNPIEIDDFIGAVYGDVKYIGRVTDKDDEKIQVSLSGHSG